MKPHKRSLQLTTSLLALIAVVTLAGCASYTVPVTTLPTQKIERRLVGDWATPDEQDVIRVRKLTETTYVVSYDGLLLRAFHSTVADVPLLSVQELETDEQAYFYLAYRLSPDGNTLYLKLINEKVISDELNDSNSIQKSLIKNLNNRSLFHAEEMFVRQEP